MFGGGFGPIPAMMMRGMGGYGMPGMGYGGYGRGYGRGRRGGGMTNPWFLMLAMQLWQQIERLPVKPPVTLAVMGASAALHFGFLNLPTGTSAAEMCLSAGAIVEAGQFYRILTSFLSYGDEMHLIYNLSSFLWKGANLEIKMGSEKFTKLLLGLLVCTNAMAVGVMYAMAAYLGMPEAYRNSCVMGNNGVNFALKTILFADEASNTSMLGIAMPSKWASWAELGLMYLMYPHTAGLVVHVCGILVGLAYLRRRTILRTLGLENWISSGGAGGTGGVGGGGGGGNYARNERGAGAAEDRARAEANRGSPGGGVGGFFRRRTNAGANLEPGTRVALAGLNAASMNGKRGVVRGRDENNGARVTVVLDGGQTFSVKPENCVVVR